MPDIGIRELKARASEIVRSVRENRSRYVVTHRGRAVAVLLPLDVFESSEREIIQDDSISPWDKLESLGEAIGKDWQSEKSSVEILSESRR